MSWFPLLEKLYNDNQDNNIVTCASCTSEGIPKLYQLHFKSFLQLNILIFTASLRQPEILSFMKRKQQLHQMIWKFDKDTFVISGKFYVVGSPTLAHRLGTPARLINVPNPTEFWERRRILEWQTISSSYRATFTWPVSGEIQNPPENAQWSAYKDSNCLKQNYGLDVGYSYTELNYMPRERNPLQQLNRVLPSNESEAQIVHDMAFNNFCLFVFKPSLVEHYSYSKQVPTRTRYDLNDEWMPTIVNP